MNCIKEHNDEILPQTKGLKSEGLMLRGLGDNGGEIQCLSIRTPPLKENKETRGNAITHPQSHPILVLRMSNTENLMFCGHSSIPV